MSIPSAFRLARILPTRDQTKLRQFLESPAFNTQTSLVRLWDWWQEHSQQPIDPEAAFKYAFPDKTFKSSEWYLLLSRLQAAIEQFLIWEEIRQDEMEQNRLLLRGFRKLKRERFFKRQVKKARTIREKRGRLEADLLYWDYALEKEYYDYISSHNRQERTNLQEVSDRLDEFFIAEKLKQACLAHSRGLANQETYNIHFIWAIEEELKRRPELLDLPAILVYQACYRAVVMGGEEQDFQHLREVIDQHQDGFPRQEMRDIYLLAINYCIRALNRGGEPFAREALALYIRSLDQGYLLEDGHIPESTFSNIVTLGLKLQRFEWVKDFIQNQSHYLRPDYQESLSAFSEARLAYEKRQLPKTLQQLAIVETKQPFLYLGAKTLQLKVFYELAEWDALYSLLDSLRVYLQRHKDLGYHKKHYSHLLTFSRKLLQLKPTDRQARQSLAEEIRNTPAFREQDWFLRQLLTP